MTTTPPSAEPSAALPEYLGLAKLMRLTLAGIDLTPERARDLADHVRRVLEADPALHLTSIREEGQ